MQLGCKSPICKCWSIAMLQQLSRLQHCPYWTRSIGCSATRTSDRTLKSSRLANSRGKPANRRKAEHRPGTDSSKQSYLVTCHPGLEEVTAGELRQPWLQEQHSLNDVSVTAPGRVTFWCDSAAAGYAAALNLRSATRVLHLIHEEQLDSFRAAGDTVYESTREALQWHEWLSPRQTFGIHCLHFYNNSNITNSQLVGRRIRDAVCDSVRDAIGTRPAPPDGTPDLPIVFQMLSDKLQLFRDLGGGSLHRRGYRSNSAVHKAALNEAAAAGLLLIAGWQERCTTPGAILADPMCGSGTFLIEAALMATQTAPGLLRDDPWPFECWHDFEQLQWQQVQQYAEERAQQGRADWAGLGGQLLGNDVHQGALALAQAAARAADVHKYIRLSNSSCGDWVPRETPSMVVANPPWGVRLLSAEEQQRPSSSSSRSRQQQQRQGYRGSYEDRQEQNVEHEELRDTWQQLSTFLKQQCPGADAWVLSGNPDVTKYLGMRSCKKRSISIGGMKTAWLKYEVRGSSAAVADSS